MSYWNHRVVKEVWRHPTLALEETAVNIYEVYYDDDGAISAWCRSDSPYGNDLEDLRGELNKMLGALDKPILVEIEGKLVEDGKDI